MAIQEELPDIVTTSDRPSQASGCPLAWESWFAQLSTWANAAGVPRWAGNGNIRLCALGGLVHVHAVVDWDGRSPVDVAQPCAMDSALLVVDSAGHVGSGWMTKGSSGIIPKGVVAGKIVVSGWFPAYLGEDVQ